MAEPGDLVLLAGKGHEKTQVIGGQELPFDEGGNRARGAGAAARQLTRALMTLGSIAAAMGGRSAARARIAR